MKIFHVFLIGLLGWLSFEMGTAASSASELARRKDTLTVDGEVRQYLLYVPKSYRGDRPVPLVISIHGYGGSPSLQQKESGWNDLADQYGFIVVYPSGLGTPKHWRASGTDESYKEIDFISALIDQLEADYQIDASRIYANGHSNGGGMTFMLACTLSDRIAAVGAVSGAYLYPWQDCNPSRPVPLIAFHGTADPVVPFSGGPSRMFNSPFPDIPTFMARYAQMNGCQTSPQMLPAIQEVSGVEYTGCSQNANVVFYTIDGGGHGWPGGHIPLPRFIVGKTTQSIDATQLMWSFFTQHSLK
jgi:polyhydroxybutyrate depolymerase